MSLALAFLACVAAFALIGWLAARRHRPSVDDYLLAGCDARPWLVALSSAATTSSGLMFIALLGFTYRAGVQAIWLPAGWIAGDVIAWRWIYPRVRLRAETSEATTVTQLVVPQDGRTTSSSLAIAVAALTLVFLCGLAGAQLHAGSVALDGFFDWGAAPGILLGGAIVVAYCLAGGLRASLWTDAAQALTLLVALGALVGFAVVEVGGPRALWTDLAAADPTLVAWSPEDPAFGLGAYALGLVFGGLGAIGQPHVLIRTMAIDSVTGMRRAFHVYLLWRIPFSFVVIAAGLCARVLVPDLGGGGTVADASIALRAVAYLVLPDAFVGVLLAAVFAATMTSAGAQLLSCSAAISQDLSRRSSYGYVKLATLTVGVLAMTSALVGGERIVALGLGAWSALGASIGPLVLLRLWGQPIPTNVGLAMMAVGLTIALAWARSPWAGDVLELLPAMIGPLIVYAIGRRVGAGEVRSRATTRS